MDITYREARRSDMPGIIRIEEEAHPLPWNEKAFICEFSKLSAGENIFLSALDENGDIVGYICGNIITDFVHIINVSVAGNLRRRGIAAAMIKRVEQEAVRRKLGSVTLEARSSNTPAIGLYQQLGYIEKGRREKAYNNKEDEIIMWKTLL